MILFLSYLVKNSMDRISVMQISYEMVSNAHVCKSDCLFKAGAHH